MKNKHILTIAALFAIGFAGCSKKFLEEKQDLTGVNEEVFSDSIVATAYIDYVYGLFQPTSGSNANVWHIATTSFNNTTDEVAGETNWNKVWPNISYTQAHALDYFGAPVTSSIQNNTWTRIKQINQFLDNVDNYGLPLDLRRRLKGQLYFWRGWQYFDLVRLYGGVPLALHSQDAVGVDPKTLEIPRSSSSATIDQICSDLDSARDMLPGRWPSSNINWGRITSGAAAALKGRVLLTWASPLFNRGDDQARWQRAYDANDAAKKLLEANNFGLYKTGTLGDGTAWENMFLAEVDNPEAVLVWGFNNTTASSVMRYNDWENQVRPKEIQGSGGFNPTKQMLDAFPMKDGKAPGQSTYTYDPQLFYKNRDPRFNKTFAYAGSLWPYAANPNFRIWTYRWFAKASDATPNSTTEQRGANNSGFYLRKATSKTANNSLGDFKPSGTDYMEMRFAEVVLNLAECAIGKGSVAEGINLIKLIRERAGIENKDGAYGLANVTSRDQAFAAVLNERKLEFAYEGKRFWDLRRWMLFNNDAGTTTRLGVAPLEGTRRTGIFIYVKNLDSSKYVGANDVDPLYKPQNKNGTGTVLIEREPVGVTGTALETHIDNLYKNYFVIKEKDDLDPTSNNWKFKWYNEYYFFGLSQKILTSTPSLEQTQGWNGLNGAGTFDPLK